MQSQIPDEQDRALSNGRVHQRRARATSDCSITRAQLGATFAACLEDPEFGQRIVGAMAALRGRSRGGGVVLVATDDLSDLATAISAAIREAWAL